MAVLPTSPIIPDYHGDVLGRVLAAAGTAIGATMANPPDWSLPPSTRVCVLLVDGLGNQLLAESRAVAPFLTSLGNGQPSTVDTLRVGFPTTTAASMGSFGTGLAPGTHGMVGYEVLDPDRDVLVNQLKWDPAVDPVDWQPHPTRFEHIAAQGIDVFRVGPARFAGSGLTNAALRGGRFIAAEKLHHVVSAGIKAFAEGARFGYLYWGGVDFIGHVYGWKSEPWRKALAALDKAVDNLARRLPADTLLLITADHGMMDLPHHRRHDLAQTPELLTGVRHIGGETRALQLYCDPEQADRVAAKFQDRFADQAWVRTRDEAIVQGWFGQVEPRVARRIGDVIVAAAGEFGLVDSRVAAPKVLELVGQHGSLTEAEQLVPLLVHRS